MTDTTFGPEGLAGWKAGSGIAEAVQLAEITGGQDAVFGAHGEAAVRTSKGLVRKVALVDANGNTGPAAIAAAALAGGRRQKWRIAGLGDSLTAINASGSNAAPGLASRGFISWANIILNGRLEFVGNLGVSGDTTAMILARVQSAIAVRPDVCTVLGGANDITTGVNPDVTIANLKVIYATLRAAGITVLAMTVTPAGVYTSAQSRLHVSKINSAIRAECRAYSGMRLVDSWQAIVNPSTGAPLSGMTYDTQHFDVAGAIAIGRLVAEALSDAPAVTDTQSYRYDPYSLVMNPEMVGDNAAGAHGFSLASGTISGTGPDGWKLDGNSTGCAAVGTGAVSRSLMSGQYPWAQIAATYSADSKRVGFLQDVRNMRTWTAYATILQSSRIRVQPTVANGFVYMPLNSGTSGATQPTWPTTLGATVTDNDVTWMCCYLPIPGQTVIRAQVDFQITGITNGVVPDMVVYCYDSSENFLNLQYHANYWTAGYGISADVPTSGTLVIPEFVLPTGCQYPQIVLNAWGLNGSAATVSFSRLQARCVV